MSGKKILYVEDNEANRMIVRDLLKRTTYELIEAFDGEAGVAKALEARARPDPDGHPAAENLRPRCDQANTRPSRVRQHADHRDHLVCAFRRRPEGEGSRRDRYLAKPYSPFELLKLVRRYLPES
jgi:two-component system cell cycle response regulator DivK